MSRQRTSTACTVEAARPSRSAIATGPSRFFQRRCTILRTTGLGVRRGQECGRELRSAIAAGPPVRYRSAHFFAVGQATLNTAAA